MHVGRGQQHVTSTVWIEANTVKGDGTFDELTFAVRNPPLRNI